MFVSSSVFATCIKGNCVNGFGTYKLNWDDTYDKNYNSKFPNGKKTWGHASSIYIGEFKGGRYEGQGTFVLKDAHKGTSEYVG